MKTIPLILLLVLARPASAFLGDGGAGWAQIPYLTKILAENVKRYRQLKAIIETTKGREDYLRMVNAGLENSAGLLNSLPIEDRKILARLKDFREAFEAVQEIYGAVPESDDGGLQRLLDQSVAESFDMAARVTDYARTQEENAAKISIQSRDASPKGAARMNAEINAQILHTLNQLLRINGQMLKLQGEGLGLSNKRGKDSAEHFNHINDDISGELRSLGFKRREL